MSTNTKQWSLEESLEVAAAQSGDHHCQKLLPCSLNFRGEGGSELGPDHNGETIGKMLRENVKLESSRYRHISKGKRGDGLP